MRIQTDVLHWLMDGDPAIRWQVRRDILHEQPSSWEAEREKLPLHGWCANLLCMQDEDDLWNRSLYNGKWISTTYSLYLLKILGLPPGNRQALAGCWQLLTRGLYQQREIRFSRNRDVADLGVTALVLSICCYFGSETEEIPRMVDFLVEQQEVNGNWLPNESPSGPDYTFETTLLVLEALLQYRNRYLAAGNEILSRAVLKGQDYLLSHSLGLDRKEPFKSKWMVFSYPNYWFYDILTALDYFQAYEQNRDGSLQPSIELLRRKQSGDGRWKLGSRIPGRTYFDMEAPGKPSRWNTLRALRVLDWWERPPGMPVRVESE